MTRSINSRLAAPTNRPGSPAAEIADGFRRLAAPHVNLLGRRRLAPAVKLNWVGLAR